MTVEIKHSICRWCVARCPVNVHVENQHLVKVTEDPERRNQVWPPTKGCVRRAAAKEWWDHPDHLRYPLKRAGEKGEGKWKQITWDQAFDEIATKLAKIKQKYGAEAVACSHGTGRTNYEFCSRFFNIFGSRNVCGQSQICHGPPATMYKTIMGWWPFYGASPLSKCYILWGREPEPSMPTEWYHIRNAPKKGKKLIVVDPRRCASASIADIHLQLRPGTDTALVLSMINVIIDENLYDKEFVKNYCHGFDQLKERALLYPPEKVAEITWLPADKIREAARMYATNKPGVIMTGMGGEHLENNAELIHARISLAAIVGNINKPGGEAMTGPHPKIITSNEIEFPDAMPAEEKRKQLGYDRFKLFSWRGYDLIQENLIRYWGKRGGTFACENNASGPLVYRAMLTREPYPIKAMITYDSNPMVTQSNTKLVYKALKSLDLYVVHDLVMTPSADLADYVLAGGSWLERPCLMDFYNNRNGLFAGVQALPTTIDGEYDHRDDFQVWRELGVRLGQEEYWPWKSMEEVFDYRLKPMGLTFAEFIAKGGVDQPPVDYDLHEKKGFATPTGKVELYSTILDKLGYDPLPAYREPSESPISQPELAQQYPYILITGGRHRPFFHSEYRHVDSLRKRHPDPLVQMHPETAHKLGIENGEWVWIETPSGRCRQKCQYFDGIDPRVIHAEHGWWFPELRGEEPSLHGVWESNINVCLDDDPKRCNPIYGSWPLKTFLCKVYKCTRYPTR